VADDLHAVDLDVSHTPLAQAPIAPGQYLKVLLPPAQEGLFAIARSQGGQLELLVKEGAPVADLLLGLPAGATLQVSAPQGPGFPLSLARGRRLLLFATGSGISAIRPVLDAVAQSRAAFGPVTLYFGARRPSAFAYAADLERWRQADIWVVQTVSAPEQSGWGGLRGYVQAHLPQERLEDAVAFVAGQPGMVEDVRRALTERGLPQERLFLNF
jgi:NAD(P)H-flavin reductase